MTLLDEKIAALFRKGSPISVDAEPAPSNEAGLFAFEEHNGNDLRDCRCMSASGDSPDCSAGASGKPIQFVEHLMEDGRTVFVCRMGLEGIVSKRMDAPYAADRSKTRLKSKNPNSEAGRREREEERR